MTASQHQIHKTRECTAQLGENAAHPGTSTPCLELVDICGHHYYRFQMHHDYNERRRSKYGLYKCCVYIIKRSKKYDKLILSRALNLASSDDTTKQFKISWQTKNLAVSPYIAEHQHSRNNFKKKKDRDIISMKIAIYETTRFSKVATSLNRQSYNLKLLRGNSCLLAPDLRPKINIHDLWIIDLHSVKIMTKHFTTLILERENYSNLEVIFTTFWTQPQNSKAKYWNWTTEIYVLFI